MQRAMNALFDSSDVGVGNGMVLFIWFLFFQVVF
jgi:hypothetical protein